MNLNSPLSEIVRILPHHKKALEKIGIKTIEDILYYFPNRYDGVNQIKQIKDIIQNENVVLYGQISSLKTTKAYIKKIPMSEGVLTDETGHIKCIWFNQPYIAKIIGDKQLVRIEGKVSERKNTLYISNPKIEKVDKTKDTFSNSLFSQNGENHHMYPVYSESKGVSSNWIFYAIQKIISNDIFQNIIDPIPEYILKKYNLPNIKTALIWIHFPRKKTDIESAKKRFAFQEIFFIQLQKQTERKEWNKQKTFKINVDKKEIDKFVKRFPFKPTLSQIKSIDSIIADLKKDKPMSRLLEGDVGSGKTAVAATIIYAVTQIRPDGKDYGNLQSAYMAPTEILARQHYENFCFYFKHLPIKIGLITSSVCQIFPSKTNKEKATKISKNQLLKWVSNGEVPILIGTHSLIQKTVNFKHLAFVVIDEQHRFGTSQRKALVQRSNLKQTTTPHLLSMTATPIPRTLALTIYGDLDLTLLDQMPSGRKPIITKIVHSSERKEAYENIRKELNLGRQLYVICPRIDEPDPTKEMAVIAKSVTMEADRLKKEVFQEFNIEFLHSKMTPTEKENIMKNFESKKIDILVATSVVEVGVNVPNATMIIIEGAERFGLSQLHQLRGRVIRSNYQAYCFIFTESYGSKTKERLKAFIKAKNGFELAEFDLIQRGAGDLYGKKQWGISDLGMEAIKNIKIVEASRNEALEIIENNKIDDYPNLKKYLEENREKIHFE